MGVGGGEKVSGVEDSCESECGCSVAVSPCDATSSVVVGVVDVEDDGGFVTLSLSM